MSQVFTQEFSVRWSDLDPNDHVRHSVYADLCAAARFSFLEKMGYGMKKLSELKMGPVIFNENINYLSEVRAGDRIQVSLQIAGYSVDGRKWKMYHELFRLSDGKLSAQLEISGAWFDLVSRRVTAPEESLLKAIEALPKAKHFSLF